MLIFVASAVLHIKKRRVMVRHTAQAFGASAYVGKLYSIKKLELAVEKEIERSA